MSSAASDNIRLTKRSIIQRIATGPELSKDISVEEARVGMTAILEGRNDPVRAGIFLVALRMKRETDEENKGILDAVRDATDHRVADVDDVVDIADPYDGYNRCLDGDRIKCPLHGSRSSLATGAPLEDPAETPVATFRVPVANGQVWLDPSQRIN